MAQIPVRETRGEAATASPAIEAAGPRRGVLALWRTTIGKKAVMAVTGLLFVAFLIAHAAGNLKAFVGAADFNGYAAWLRTIGAPVLPGSGYLWVQRVVLTAALGLHVTAAAQLSRRAARARPHGYAHRMRPRATYATRTMRWGGVIVGLFVVWHLLDLTVGVANPDYASGRPYHNVVADFRVWWINMIYLVAVALVGLHVNHGFWSAAQTLGVNRPARERTVRAAGTTIAVAITAGFAAVPVGVMAGLVR